MQNWQSTHAFGLALLLLLELWTQQVTRIGTSLLKDERPHKRGPSHTSHAGFPAETCAGDQPRRAETTMDPENNLNELKLPI